MKLKEIGQKIAEISNAISAFANKITKTTEVKQNDETLNLYKYIIELYKKVQISNDVKLNDKIYSKLIDSLENIDFKKFKILVNQNSKKDSYGLTTDFGWYYKGSLDDICKGIVENIKKEKKRNYLRLKNLIQFKNELNGIKRHEIVLNNDNVKKRKLENLDEIPIAKVGRQFNKDKLFKYIVIDIETTGLQANVDEIIEISAIKYVDHVATECFTTLIKPKNTIPLEITGVNGITNSMVEQSPIISEIISNFNEFIDGYHLVGYNIVFDLKFLYCNGFNVLNKKNIKIYDAYELVKKVYKKNDLPNYKLDTICKNILNLYRNDSHRSLSDCLATNMVFCRCINELTDK